MADMWLKFKAGAQAAGNSASKAAEKTKLQGEIALLKRVPAPVAFRRARSLVPLLGARSRARRRRLGRVRRVARSRARSAVDASAPQAMGLQIYDALSLGDHNETARVFGQFKAQVDDLEAQIKEKNDRIEVLDYR